ncbi:MAG: CARDB domain-containing protein [Chitinophagaceae bacterium]|nr:CARDB domain-containing protein [Chitinophagaceae bacterium]
MKCLSYLFLFFSLTFFAGETRAQAKPDLVVREIIAFELSFDSSRSMNRVKVLAKIGNAGAAPAGNSMIEMRVYQQAGANPAGWFGLAPVPIPGISARRDTLMEFIFNDPNNYAKPGRYPIQLLLDPRRMVDEANETNNTLAKELTAQGNQGPSVAAISRVPNTIQATANIRSMTAFSTKFQKGGDQKSLSGDMEFRNGTIYNLDPQYISIGSTFIQIKKGGIYHFDIFMDTYLSLLAPSSAPPFIRATLNTDHRVNQNLLSYVMMNEQMNPVSFDPASPYNRNFAVGKMSSLEIYLPGPTTIEVGASFVRPNAGATLSPESIFSCTVIGYISGYLVREF